MRSSEPNGTQEADLMEPWLSNIVEHRRRRIMADGKRVRMTGGYRAGLRRRGGRS